MLVVLVEWDQEAIMGLKVQLKSRLAINIQAQVDLVQRQNNQHILMLDL